MINNWLNILAPELIKKLKVIYLSNDYSWKDSTRGEQHLYHKEIFELLVDIGLDVTPENCLATFIRREETFDYVFSLLNRAKFRNSEIFVSAVCEHMKIPYLGARPNIRALAEDKNLTKIYANQFNIPTSPWKLYRASESIVCAPNFSGPYFVKWSFGASSRSIEPNSITSTWEETKIQIMKLHSQDKDAMVEEFLPGRSFTVPVIGSFQGPKVFPVIETVSSEVGGIVTYSQARGLSGGIERSLCQEPKLKEQLSNWSKTLYNSLGNIDYLRADFKMDYLNNPQLLEFNICCNISSNGAICQSSQAINISQKELVSHIISYSIGRQRKRV